MLGVLHAERRRHLGAPIATLGTVVGVTKPRHQLIPDVCDALRAPPWPRRLVAKPEPWQRRADHVERVASAPAEGHRIGQWLYDLADLPDRALSCHRGGGVGVGRAASRPSDRKMILMGPSQSGDSRRWAAAASVRNPALVNPQCSQTKSGTDQAFPRRGWTEPKFATIDASPRHRRLRYCTVGPRRRGSGASLRTSRPRLPIFVTRGG